MHDAVPGPRRRGLLAVPFVALALGAVCAAPAAAQVDPQEAVRKILDEVAEEMREIDRLLLESSRRDAAERIAEATARMQELIDRSQDSQGRVVRGIEELIKQLDQMSQSSRSGQPQDSDQQNGRQQRDRQRQQRDGEEPQQRPSTRQENRTPDMAPQQRPDGQQPQDQPQRGDDARTDQRDPDGGRNTRQGQLPEGATEDAARDGEDGAWGGLPKYLQFLHSRGGQPELPPKYRRLIEAYLKRSQNKDDRR